ncbi:hypothetical protein B382_23638 [Stutzerimonas stutzeri B1SMN1]|nr:hypothetical protein B382_23638 [Stutzerimonas stutzeri B1SMN1]
MNDTLKVAGRIGAELGAAKAEVERLREQLSAVTAERDRLLEELAATNRGINAKLPRRKFAAVGTGALYAEQNYCYRRGWKEGVAALRAQIRAAAMAAKEA